MVVVNVVKPMVPKIQFQGTTVHEQGKILKTQDKKSTYPINNAIIKERIMEVRSLCRLKISSSCVICLASSFSSSIKCV